MSFTDALKRSLGFEESESSSKVREERNVNSISDNISQLLRNLTNSSNNEPQQQNTTQKQYNPRPNPAQSPNQHPRPTPIFDDDDYVIIPDRSFYEIVLFRPKNIDDVNYVVDQILEEKNPVILDLSFLEKESPANFKLAGEKIKQMRERHGAQALLLSRTEDKNLIILSPRKVKIINKG